MAEIAGTPPLLSSPLTPRLFPLFERCGVQGVAAAKFFPLLGEFVRTGRLFVPAAATLAGGQPPVGQGRTEQGEHDPADAVAIVPQPPRAVGGAPRERDARDLNEPQLLQPVNIPRDCAEGDAA